MIQSTITYGSHKILYNVAYSDRKTLAISVYPDCSVKVKSPNNIDLEQIDEKVRNRASWILKQQEYFEQFCPKTPPSQYVSGETHLYLGRKYRLKVIKAEHSLVKLLNGCIQINTPNPDNKDLSRKLLENWYQQRAKIKFKERFSICWDEFQKYDFPCPMLQIRSLKKRWGSLTLKGKIILNQELIRADISCIDYVITHELCHLKHFNHSKKFYEFLSQIMPDWESRKKQLEKLLQSKY